MTTIDQKRNNENNEGQNAAGSECAIVNNNSNSSGNNLITGNWTSGWHRSHRYRGWNPEGLNHFNKLVKMVKQDRDNNMHFQEEQHKIWLNKGKKRNRKRKPSIQSFKHVKISPHWKSSTMATNYVNY